MKLHISQIWSASEFSLQNLYYIQQICEENTQTDQLEDIKFTEHQILVIISKRNKWPLKVRITNQVWVGKCCTV